MDSVIPRQAPADSKGDRHMDTLNAINTTDEAARFLRLQKQTLESWRLKGIGPVFVKLGRRVVYRREALERFMAERERRSTSDTGSQLSG